MEMIGLMLRAIFWLTALVVWLVVCCFAVRRYGRPARIVRNVGVCVWLVLVVLVDYAMGEELLLTSRWPVGQARGTSQCEVAARARR